MKPIESLCILGAGNVATHMACALKQKGCHITCVYSRTLPHAQQLARILDGANAVCRLDAVPRADAYLFAVKDDALRGVAEDFARLHHGTEGLFIHTAGSRPLSVWDGITTNGAVLYPLQTFSLNRRVDFSHLPLLIEATSDISLETVRQLAQTLSDNVTTLDSEQRRAVHLAAVFANNFTNQCYAIAYRLMEERGIAPQLLQPLIDETARKIHDLPPVKAQTGPAVRWDTQVMESQERLLSAHPSLREIYKLMSLSIHHIQTDAAETT